MSTEEILLTVLTIAIVILIIVVIAVLLMVLRVARKIKHLTEQAEAVADRGAKVAETLTPIGVTALGVLQALKILLVKRR